MAAEQSDKKEEAVEAVSGFASEIVSVQGYPHDTDAALEALFLRYERQRKPIAVSFRRLVPWLKVGERATHYLHSYPAKLLPQIAHFFLASTKLCPSNGTVLDPFGGTGTVALEACLSGRRALYADSNPLARLIAAAKLTPLSDRECHLLFDRVRNRYKANKKTAHIPLVVNITYWFEPTVIRELARIREAILKERNLAGRQLLLATFSAVCRKVSLADPRLSVPVRRQTDRGKGEQPPLVWDSFVKQFEANRRRLADLDGMLPSKWQHTCVGNDARMLKQGSAPLPANSVDLILTSPPYAGAQKYIRASSLSLGWLGLACEGELKPLENQTIGREHLDRNSSNLGQLLGCALRTT